MSRTGRRIAMVMRWAPLALALLAGGLSYWYEQPPEVILCAVVAGTIVGFMLKDTFCRGLGTWWLKYEEHMENAEEWYSRFGSFQQRLKQEHARENRGQAGEGEAAHWSYRAVARATLKEAASTAGEIAGRKLRHAFLCALVASGLCAVAGAAAGWHFGDWLGAILGALAGLILGAVVGALWGFWLG
jgi:hypothetical protein